MNGAIELEEDPGRTGVAAGADLDHHDGPVGSQEVQLVAIAAPAPGQAPYGGSHPARTRVVHGGQVHLRRARLVRDERHPAPVGGKPGPREGP